MATRVVTISVPKGIRAVIRDAKGPGRPKTIKVKGPGRPKKRKARKKRGPTKATRRTRRTGTAKKARVLRAAARLVARGKSRSAALKQAWRNA